MTFGHLPSARCLTEIDERFDIAIIGAPFDTAVSYRPGELREICYWCGDDERPLNIFRSPFWTKGYSVRFFSSSSFPEL